jgi:hypothetical protein
MVTTTVEKQPVPREYVIVDVPAVTPVTVPVEPTVATEVVLLDHVPPGILFPSEVVPPVQAEGVPVIAEGAEITLTDVVDMQAEPIE